MGHQNMFSLTRPWLRTQRQTKLCHCLFDAQRGSSDPEVRDGTCDENGPDENLASHVDFLRWMNTWRCCPHKLIRQIDFPIRCVKFNFFNFDTAAFQWTSPDSKQVPSSRSPAYCQPNSINLFDGKTNNLLVAQSVPNTNPYVMHA